MAADVKSIEEVPPPLSKKSSENRQYAANNTAVPIMMQWEETLSQIKLHRQRRQVDSTTPRYVLFILDSSGSIGSDNFNKVLNATRHLALYFCNPHYAVLSYSSQIYREVCFDCNLNHVEIYNQMKNIPFINGRTASGDALECACNYMFTRKCGFNPKEDSIVDLIFLTDGHSNEGVDVCKASKCLFQVEKKETHDIGIEVFSIGIGDNVNWDEINCISKGHHKTSGGELLHINDLDELQELVDKIIDQGSHQCIGNLTRTN